jgi:putative transposase
VALRPTITMKEFYLRHLPHWQPQGAVFFVTFRLKNSLPYEVIESLHEERERTKGALHYLPEPQRAHQNTLDEQHYFKKWEEYLDKAESGPRWLATRLIRIGVPLRPTENHAISQTPHRSAGKYYS